MADSLRNGRRVRGDNHPFTKILDAQVREIRLALSRGKRVGDLAPVYSVHKSTVSRIKHGEAASRASRAEHDRRVVPPGPVATDPSLRSPIAPRSVSPYSKLSGAAGLLEHRLEVRLRGLQSIMVMI